MLTRFAQHFWRTQEMFLKIFRNIVGQNVTATMCLPVPDVQTVSRGKFLLTPSHFLDRPYIETSCLSWSQAWPRRGSGRSAGGWRGRSDYLARRAQAHAAPLGGRRKSSRDRQAAPGECGPDHQVRWPAAVCSFRLQSVVLSSAS